MLDWRYRRVRRTTLIALLSLGCLLGIGSVKLGISFSDISIFIAAIILTALCIKRRAYVAIPAAILAGILFGLWRGSAINDGLSTLQDYQGQKVMISGTIVEDPTYGKRGESQFVAGNLKLGDKHYPGQVRVSTSEPVTFYRGDRVTVKGKLTQGFANYQAKASFAEVREHIKGDDPWVAIRDTFAAGVRNALPEPAASLGIGFLLGQRSALPDDLDEKLRVVGLTHIVVASGYNLTVLVRAARRILAPVSKYQAALFGAGLMSAFVFITGFTPSMTRAALVTGLALTAWYYGRKIHPIVLILFAAAATGLINPIYVWSDLGWYLSFLAFGGVLILAPLLKTRIWGKNNPSFITQIVIETIAATIMTIPIIVLIFGQVSVFTVIANALVVPLIPFAMLFTAVAGVVGMVAPAIAGFAGVIAGLIMGYMLGIVDILSNFEYALLDYSMNIVAMLGLYILVALVCFVLWRKSRYNFLDGNVVD